MFFPSRSRESWMCVRRRAGSCRSTPTLFSSRSQTTAPISWSRLSMPWRSRADTSDLGHNLADPWCCIICSRAQVPRPPLNEAPGRRRVNVGIPSHPAELFLFAPLLHPGTYFHTACVLSSLKCRSIKSNEARSQTSKRCQVWHFELISDDTRQSLYFNDSGGRWRRLSGKRRTKVHT